MIVWLSFCFGHICCLLVKWDTASRIYPSVAINPQKFPLLIIQNLILPLCVFLFFVSILIKCINENKSTWFFLGATSTSLVYAGYNLFQIAILYYQNVGHFPFNVEGYTYPAIYTFKLFKSIFLASLFGILGYWFEVLKKRSRIRSKSRNQPFNFFRYFSESKTQV